MGSSNGNFGASYVRLSSVEFETFVESDDLGSNEVIAGREVGRNSPVEFTETGSKFIDAPLLGLLVVSVFEDFEPNGSRSSFRFSHVDNARSSVVRSDDVSIRSSKSHFVMELVDHFRTRVNGAFSVSLLRGSW